MGHLKKTLIFSNFEFPRHWNIQTYKEVRGVLGAGHTQCKTVFGSWFSNPNFANMSVFIVLDVTNIKKIIKFS